MIYAVIGGTILVIAIFGGIFLAKKNQAEQQNQLKVMLFVLYFWILVFVQIMLFAIVYCCYGEFN